MVFGRAPNRGGVGWPCKYQREEYPHYILHSPASHSHISDELEFPKPHPNMPAMGSLKQVAAAAIIGTSAVLAKNTSYHNPVLPGWHSDPSCTFVPELDNTFFCTTSSFYYFPGNPIFASKDLVNWKHVSNTFNRPDQVPGWNNIPFPAAGMFASTIRYHEGKMYLVTYDIAAGDRNGGMLFTATNPYDDASWQGPQYLNFSSIDPDIFWESNGDTWTVTAAGRYDPAPGLNQAQFSIPDGTVDQPPVRIFNGSAASPEGPNIYKRNGTYYLLFAEGGTEINHRASIARSTGDIRGPYVGNPNNPILTAVNTTNYFQSAGHCDLFPDANDNWWVMCLARRSGPSYAYYPLSRESVLAPCTWTAEGWPVCDQIFGNMTGPLPAENKDIPGEGYFVGKADYYKFESGSSMPRNFITYGIPNNGTYTISPSDHPNTLRLAASPNDTAAGELSLIARVPTDTEYCFSAEMEFEPASSSDEAGLTVFLAPDARLDVGITLDPSTNSKAVRVSARISTAMGQGTFNGTAPEDVYLPLSSSPAYLEIKAVNQTYFSFSAGSSESNKTVITHLPSSIVSGDIIGEF